MSGRRVSDGQLKACLSALSHVSDHDGASVLLKAARDLIDCRETNAVYERALTKAGEDICRLNTALAASQAAHRDALDEIAGLKERLAAAERHTKRIDALLELSKQATQGIWLHTHGAIVADKI